MKKVLFVIGATLLMSLAGCNSASSKQANLADIEEEQTVMTAEESSLLGYWYCESFTNAEDTFTDLTGDDEMSFTLEEGGTGSAVVSGFEYEIDSWKLSRDGTKLKIDIEGDVDNFIIVERTEEKLLLDEEIGDETIHFVFRKK